MRALAAGETTATYLIVADASPYVGGYVTGSGYYSGGEFVTARAYPTSGYYFAYWWENGAVVSFSPVYTFSATTNRTLIAVFEPITSGSNSSGSSNSSSSSNNTSHQVAISSTHNGTLTVSPRSAKSGDTVTIITAPSSGYVTGDVSVADRSGNFFVRDNGNNTYTFVMPDSSVTVSATFTAAESSTNASNTTGTIPNASTNASSEVLWISPFTDVLGVHGYYDDVGYVVRNGLMSGVDSRHFDPNGNLTRGMVMTILARMKGVDTSGSIPWYQTGMAWAKQAGISDGTNPEATITREELVTMLWRYAGQPAAVTGPLIAYPTVVGDMMSYNDAGDVSTWAYSAMTWAVQNGIIDGPDGKLYPHDNALRADTATILTRFCKKIGR